MANTAKDLTNYNTDVARIREALKGWLDAGVGVFLLLREVEQAGNWKLGGHTNFGEFLAKEFPNSIGTYRYRSVIDAVGVYSEKFVRLVGPEGAHALCHPKILGSEQKRNAVIADVLETVRKTGAAPCREELVRLVRHHAGDVQSSNVASQADRIRRETSEINELRAELREANAKLRVAEKRTKDLETRCAKLEKERDEAKRRNVQLSKEVVALKLAAKRKR